MDVFFLKQIIREGKLRYEDGVYLEGRRDSDSGYLLKLLGFELLLKAALYAEKSQENHNHNYYAVYCTLSPQLKIFLISEAQIESQVFDIEERVEIILKWYRYNFVRLRYPFQSYKGMSESEYEEYSNLYAELGCPEGEAEFEYYPRELHGLYIALEIYLNKKLQIT